MATIPLRDGERVGRRVRRLSDAKRAERNSPPRERVFLDDRGPEWSVDRLDLAAEKDGRLDRLEHIASVTMSVTNAGELYGWYRLPFESCEGDGRKVSPDPLEAEAEIPANPFHAIVNLPEREFESEQDRKRFYTAHANAIALAADADGDYVRIKAVG